MRMGLHRNFMKKCIFWPIFRYCAVFHHIISILWSKHSFCHEVQSFSFRKWVYFWSDHVYFLIYHPKREDSCSKNLYFSGKITLFFLSLFSLKCLWSPILMDLGQDIWQIIFELVLFYEVTVGKAQARSSFALEGGGLEFGSPCTSKTHWLAN